MLLINYSSSTMCHVAELMVGLSAYILLLLFSHHMTIAARLPRNANLPDVANMPDLDNLLLEEIYSPVEYLKQDENGGRKWQPFACSLRLYPLPSSDWQKWKFRLNRSLSHIYCYLEAILLFMAHRIQVVTQQSYCL